MPTPSPTQAKTTDTDCDHFDVKTIYSDVLDAQIFFDDERVFRRLRVYDNSMGKLVHECAENMKSNSTILSCASTLQRIAEDAERCETRCLDVEEMLWEELEIRTEAEKDMYEPLVWCLYDALVDYD